MQGVLRVEGWTELSLSIKVSHGTGLEKWRLKREGQKCLLTFTLSLKAPSLVPPKNARREESEMSLSQPLSPVLGGGGHWGLQGKGREFVSI